MTVGFQTEHHRKRSGSVERKFPDSTYLPAFWVNFTRLPHRREI